MGPAPWLQRLRSVRAEAIDQPYRPLIRHTPRMWWPDFDLDAGANVTHHVGHGLRECRRQLLVGHDMSLHPKPLQETIPASLTCFDRAPATVDSIEAIGRPCGSQVRRIVESNGPNVGTKGTPQGDRLSIDVHPQDPNEQ